MAIRIGPARAQDIKALRVIAETCGMHSVFSPQNCLIAYEDGRPVGFTRVEFVYQVPYIRPVAVLPTERGKGIGKRLLGIVLSLYPEVRAISRGGAAEFYRNLGFQRMSWDDVHSPIRDECEQCPEKRRCGPLPMVHLQTSNLQQTNESFS